MPWPVTIAILLSPSAPLCERIESLRRDGLRIEVAPASAIEAPPTDAVYVFGCDRATLGALQPAGAWLAAHHCTAGSIAVIERGTEGDREAALACGVDDAVSSQVHPRELAGRIRSLGRRIEGCCRTSRIRCGRVTLDLAEQLAWDDTGRRSRLTGRETAVLRELIAANGRALTYRELYRAAWSDDRDDAEAARGVQNIIRRLRTKFREPDTIETVRNIGLRLGVR